MEKDNLTEIILGNKNVAKDGGIQINITHFFLNIYIIIYYYYSYHSYYQNHKYLLLYVQLQELY